MEISRWLMLLLCDACVSHSKSVVMVLVYSYEWSDYNKNVSTQLLLYTVRMNQLWLSSDWFHYITFLNRIMINMIVGWRMILRDTSSVPGGTIPWLKLLNGIQLSLISLLEPIFLLWHDHYLLCKRPIAQCVMVVEWHRGC